MKKIYSLITPALLLAAHVALADANSALSLPGYFGNINNNTDYVVECSQVIGGYCANNPMPANGYIQMLLDPGSNQIRGHLMIYQKNVPGKYLDNISFVYKEQSNNQWQFTTQSLYHQVAVKMIMPDTLLLEPKE